MSDMNQNQAQDPDFVSGEGKSRDTHETDQDNDRNDNEDKDFVDPTERRPNENPQVENPAPADHEAL